MPFAGRCTSGWNKKIDMELNKVYLGDALETIKAFPDECLDCVVTSPPYYGLRDYGVDGQIGLEDTPPNT